MVFHFENYCAAVAENFDKVFVQIEDWPLPKERKN